MTVQNSSVSTDMACKIIFQFPAGIHFSTTMTGCRAQLVFYPLVPRTCSLFNCKVLWKCNISEPTVCAMEILKNT